MTIHDATPWVREGDSGRRKPKWSCTVTIGGRTKGTNRVKEKALVSQCGFGGLLLFGSAA